MGGKPTNTTVTLTVDTNGITEANKNDKVVFTDDQSDPVENPGHPETYLSTVNKGARIIFKGVPKSGSDQINITSVVKKASGGSDILVQPIAGATNNPNGGDSLTAVVAGQQITGDEYYTVSFNINGNPPEYPIDPKIKMNA